MIMFIPGSTTLTIPTHICTHPISWFNFLVINPVQSDCSYPVGVGHPLEGGWLGRGLCDFEENQLPFSQQLSITNSDWTKDGASCTSPSRTWDFVWLEFLQVFWVLSPGFQVLMCIYPVLSRKVILSSSVTSDWGSLSFYSSWKFLQSWEEGICL